MPSLRHTFIEQTLQPGPPVSLKCTALGHPTPVITWSLDGRPLAPSSGHYGGQRVGVGSWVDVGGQVVSQVNISSAGPMDGGLYACAAANSAGRVAHSARLNVYGGSSTPSGRPFPADKSEFMEILIAFGSLSMRADSVSVVLIMYSSAFTPTPSPPPIATFCFQPLLPLPPTPSNPFSPLPLPPTPQAPPAAAPRPT